MPPANSSAELRPALRMLIPHIAIVTVPIAPVTVYFVTLSSFRIVAAALVLLLELVGFGCWWLALNAQFVRADETGIVQSLRGRECRVSWNEAANIEVLEHASWRESIYKIKNQTGETILEFSDFGNKTDGVKMHDFIAAKLAERR